MHKVLKRLREPSTYAGLAAVAAGIGQVGNVNEAMAVSEVINSQGMVLGGMLAGVLAMFMGEKGAK